jgi:hypothetical protein
MEGQNKPPQNVILHGSDHLSDIVEVAPQHDDNDERRSPGRRSFGPAG